MKAALLIVVTLIATCAYAQDSSEPVSRTRTAGYIAGICKAVLKDDASATEDTIACINRILGWREVIDMTPVLYSSNPSERTVDVQLHLDPTATNGQLIRVFLAYVAAHPAIENKQALVVFISALEDAKLMTEEPVIAMSSKTVKP